jgi:hypothetical protein
MTVDETGLRKLSAAVEFLLDQEFFASTVERLKEELGRFLARCPNSSGRAGFFA